VKQARTLMLPPDVRETARAGGCTIAFEHALKKQYGVQMELERNDPEGTTILRNFALEICGCSDEWTQETALEQAMQTLEEAAASGGVAICAVSGGVDSTVCALLTRRAFGENMKAVFVDTGLMRADETQQVRELFSSLSIPLEIVDRSGEILERLAHKKGLEEKQAVVTESMDSAMMEHCLSIAGDKTIVLGTNYTDYLNDGSSAVKWSDSGMKIVEPLTDMLKQEVRDLAERMEMGESVVNRKPFPALGLGARIIGEVTGERLHTLRTAEVIFREEITEAGLERKLYKYFPILVCADAALSGEVIFLRAVTLSGSQLMPARLPHDLLERTVQRIMAATPDIERIFYDQTPTQAGKESFF